MRTILYAVKKLFLVNAEDVKEYPLKGANKVGVRYLLHAGVGAKRLQLRLFTVDVGGYTPLEKHAHEHEVFVLEGEGLFLGEGREVKAFPGDAVFIASSEPHQVKNIGKSPLRFLCTKETGLPPPIECEEEKTELSGG